MAHVGGLFPDYRESRSHSLRRVITLIAVGWRPPDLSPSETRGPLDIGYRAVNVVALPFAETTFDFVTGFVSFMGIPRTDRVPAEAYLTLKPGGFLQFCITYPCYDTLHRQNLRHKSGRTSAMELVQEVARLNS